MHSANIHKHIDGDNKKYSIATHEIPRDFLNDGQSGNWQATDGAKRVFFEKH